MATKDLANIVSPISTSGTGYDLENAIQSLFMLTMLVEGHAICLENCKISKIIFQARRNGIYTDDLVVCGKGDDGEHHLFIQIKRQISFCKSDERFKKVINDSWHDFQNKNFCFGKDKLLLATGPLSHIDIVVTRHIFEIARAADTYFDFETKINTQGLFSTEHRKKLSVIRELVIQANDGKSLSDKKFFDFLRSFYIVGFDLEIRESIDKMLLKTISSIGFKKSFNDVWSRISDFCRFENSNAGEVSFNSTNQEYVALKRLLRNTQTISAEFNENVEIIDYKNYSALTKFVLFGIWNETNQNDVKAIELLFGKEYNSIKNELLELQKKDDKNFKKENPYWHILKENEVNKAFQSSISESILNDFTKCAEFVLDKILPQYNLLKEERYKALFLKKDEMCTKELRDSVVEGFVYLWVYRESFKNIKAEEIQNTINSFLFKLLRNKDWKIWASLNDYLPDFAEIAPDTFLKLLQESIVYKKDEIIELFKNEGDGIFSGTLISGILWALEKLSFCDNLFPIVIDVLIALCQLDIGGRFSNRPYNSLVELFRPWINQNRSNLDQKINLLKKIVSQDYLLGDKLLLDLLNSRDTISAPIAKPNYNSKLIINSPTTVTTSEFEKLKDAYTEFLIEEMKIGHLEIAKVIKNFDELYGITQKKVLDFFGCENIFIKLNGEQKYQVWYTLSLLIKKHKQFEDSNWAFSKETLEKLECYCKICESNDLLLKNKILFSEWENVLFDKKYKDDWDAARDDVFSRRDIALREILDIHGIKILEAYIESEIMANTIGQTLSRIIKENEIKELFPKILNTKDNLVIIFYKSFLYGIDKDDEFIHELDFSTWSEPQKLKLFINLRFEERNWKLAESSLTNPKEYWKNVQELPLRSNSDLSLPIQKFVEYKRFDYALQSLFAQLYNKQNIDNTLLLEALLANTKKIDEYQLKQLIKYAQEKKLEHEKLILIEWKYLFVFYDDDKMQPCSLFSELQNNPDFFIEILSMAYKAKNDELKKELTEKESINATNAYRLLHEWKNVPGIKNDNFDLEKFQDWINLVLEKAKNCRRLEVAQLIIGRVLFYSPSDESGLWIDKNIATVLDKFENMRMLDGFYDEVINSRGIYTVDYTGQSELELANYWKDRANKLKENGFYNFAKTLENLYEMYVEDSERAKKMQPHGTFTYIVKKDGGEILNAKRSN